MVWKRLANVRCRGGQCHNYELQKVCGLWWSTAAPCCYPTGSGQGNCVVQRFPPQPTVSRATVRHTDYNSNLLDVYCCISVLTDNKGAFHGPGNSGLVVTSLLSAEFPHRVDPIGERVCGDLVWWKRLLSLFGHSHHKESGKTPRGWILCWKANYISKWCMRV